MSFPNGTTVSVPERVAFVNLNSGKVFFDCHPSEARAAMLAVTDMRANGSPEARQQKKEAEELKAIVDKVLASGARQHHVELVGEPDGSLTTEFVNGQMHNIERQDRLVDYILVNANLYGWFRSLGNVVFESYTQKDVLMSGRFGRLWGHAELVVRAACKPNEIYFISSSDEGMALLYTRCRITYKPATKTSLGDVLDKLRKLGDDLCVIGNQVAELTKQNAISVPGSETSPANPSTGLSIEACKGI